MTARGDVVVVTGMGAYCAAGADVAALWASLREGRTGIRRVERFDTSVYAGPFAGEIPWDPAARLPPGVATGERVLDYALVAAREAWAHADLELRHLETRRCGVVIGTSSGGHAGYDVTDEDVRLRPAESAKLKARGLHWRVAAQVAEHLGLGGPRLTVSSACSSGTLAIGYARDLLQSGQLDLVLVGGVDGLFEQKYAGFHALGAISPGPCAPFSEPVGMNLGEGAGFLVLERGSHADAREAPRVGYVLGYGLSADAFHPTAPDPEGRGIARAIQGALDDAGLSADAVDHYSAHATGTELNDPAEWRAVVRVFGRTDRIAVNGPKSFLGHAFGAAGTLESIATLLALEHQEVPPTLHFRGPRPTGPTDPVAGPRARPARVQVALCNNSAFGGSNATVAFGCARPPRPLARQRPLYVAGVGVVGAHGSADALEVLDRGVPLGQEVEHLGWRALAGRPPDRIEREVRSVDPRELDPAGTWLTLAASRALRDGGVAISDATRDRAGLVVGTCRRPHRSHGDFRDSYTRRGLARASASAFARTVMNAAPGAAARALSLRGLHCNLAAGPGCGLFAIAAAAHHLATRTDVDVLVAGGFDELDLDVLVADPERPAERALEGAGFHGEGSSTVALCVEPAPVRIDGWGLGGPGDLAGAIHFALRGTSQPVVAVFSSAGGARGRARELSGLRAALGPSLPPVRPSPAGVLGYGPASTASTALAWAALTLRAGALEPTGDGLCRALVVCDDLDVGACAIVLAAEGGGG